MNNARALLTIYDLILSDKPCCIKDMIEKSDCSRRTCFRYMKVIRFHLIDTNSPKQIYYDKKIKRYELMDASSECVKAQNARFIEEYLHEEEKERKEASGL